MAWNNSTWNAYESNRSTQYNDHCAPFLNYFQSNQSNLTHNTLPELKTDYLERTLSFPTKAGIISKLSVKKGTNVTPPRVEQQYLTVPDKAVIRPDMQYMSVQNHCCCHQQSHQNYDQSNHNQACMISLNSRLPSDRHQVQRISSRQHLPTDNTDDASVISHHDNERQPSAKLRSRDRRDLDGPSPRSMSPVPTRLSRDDKRTREERELASAQQEIEQLKRELNLKTEEAEAAAQQFDSMEAMIRKLHDALKSEKGRTRSLEQELLKISQATGNNSPASRSNLEVIEKKYKELKAFIEKTGISSGKLGNLKVYEQGLIDCFELFTGIFESIVINKNQKSIGYESVQNLIMIFFERQNTLIQKFGYQEKLIGVLKAYKSRQTTANKISHSDLSPVRLEQRLIEANKENWNMGNRPSRSYINSEQRYSQSSSKELDHLDSSDSITNYDFQLQ